MIKKFYSGYNFDGLYHAMLKGIYNDYEFRIADGRIGGSIEVTNLSFELFKPMANVVVSEARNFKFDFAQKFFEWMMSGSTDISLLIPTNHNAKNFMAEGELPDTFSTAYGPRLIRQLSIVMDELRDRQNSRRAIMHILEEGDNCLLNIKTKIEFPCADSVQIMIRDEALHMYVNMRSNNMVTTICYDVYNFTNLQWHILMQLEDVYPNLQMGSYHHRITSAHILDTEIKLANKIINEHDKH